MPPTPLSGRNDSLLKPKPRRTTNSNCCNMSYSPGPTPWERSAMHAATATCVVNLHLIHIAGLPHTPCTIHPPQMPYMPPTPRPPEVATQSVPVMLLSLTDPANHASSATTAPATQQPHQQYTNCTNKSDAAENKCRRFKQCSAASEQLRMKSCPSQSSDCT